MSLTQKKSNFYHIINISNRFFLFVIIFSQVLFAQNSKHINIFSAQNKLKFANSLFCENDYLRAIDEYQSFLRIANNDTARFKMALSFQRMNRFEEAGDNFKSLFFNSSLEDLARLEFYKSYFLMGDYRLLRKYAEIKSYRTEVYDKNIDMLIGFSYLKNNSFIPDSSDFFNLFGGEEKEEMLKFYYKKQHPNFKSELTGGLLSAIVPGLGKVYAEEYGDGITAFLMTGLFTFLAVDNFNHDHNARAWIFTGFATYFYAGNIYGSVAAVQNFNAGIRFSFDKEFSTYLGSKNYFLPENNFLCD